MNKYKTLLSVFAFLLVAFSYAQNSINYKAIIKDNSGNVVANDLIQVQFSILQGVAQTNVYQENHTPTTDANGIIILNIGEGTTADIFTDINWASDTHFLNVQVNTGSGLVDLGTTEFMAVPYAKHANTATTALNAGATNINGLTDGKSDYYGSSLFLGGGAGASDDGTGNNNIGIGFNSLSSNATGDGNVATGTYTLFGNTTGNENIAIGHYALYVNNGSGNIALGSQAGFNETGSNKLYIANSSTSTPLIYGEFDTQKLTINGDLEVTGSNNLSSGLEAIDEGNDIGWRLKGQNPANYGNIGLKAVDLSQGISNSTTIGATGAYSTAIGSVTTASGNSSTAMGSSTIASGVYATAMGFFTEASRNYSTAMGYSTTASGSASTAMGESTTASGSNSTAMGYNTQAKENYTTAMGSYNYDSVGPDRLLIVGNGSSNSTRSNAFTVYQGSDADLTTYNSGYVMIGNNSSANLLFDTNEIMARNNGVAANLHLQGNGGNVYVNGAIVLTSDRRLKKDITSLQYGLKEILKLNPVAYNWKNRTNQKHKSLGLIAQELQEVVSNVVYEDEDTQKTLHVNYTELIPVLINAIKEQQEIIESQQLEVSSLQSTVGSQKEDYSALLERIVQLERKGERFLVKENR